MTLAHDVVGSGPAVLLLHSAVCDRRMWEPIPGHRAIRCDFRGFGSSPAATGPYRDADDVIEVLDYLGVGRTALVGSSYGGAVSLEIAAR